MMKAPTLFLRDGVWRRSVSVLMFGGMLCAVAGVLPVGSGAAVLVSDPKDIGDSSGDMRSIGAEVRGDVLYLFMTVDGVAAPSVENTPEGMVNRYYYHWLLDTDDNPATGRSNAEYEQGSTGLENPIGAEVVVQVGWRDGKPNGVYAVDALTEAPLAVGFPVEASGNSITAAIPLADLGLVDGQTVALSAFQEGASEDWTIDWMESAELVLEGPDMPILRVSDPADLGDLNGDIRQISAQVIGDFLQLSMTVEGVAGASVANTAEGMVNRYYYHWLIDTDNNPATGRSNAEYEQVSTGVERVIGADRTVMFGWRDGKREGVEVYEGTDDNIKYLLNFPVRASGNTLTALVPLEALGVARGQTVSISAYQEGASEGWIVDWMESAELVLEGPNPPVLVVEDPADLGDSSGDIRSIAAHVWGDELLLVMGVEGVAGSAVEHTPEGMVNRYYYHWLIDTDNNPATGRSNAEYEQVSTGVERVIGADRTVMFGWRDGKREGIEVYEGTDDSIKYLLNFPVHASGNSLFARVPLSALGVALGQTVSISAYQEGASEGWVVDWMESDEIVLESGVGESGPRLSIESDFEADAFGFEIELIDDAEGVADAESIQLALDGEAVTGDVSKAGGVTTITGRHGALLESGSVHELLLTVDVSGETQSRRFVFTVASYTVLPTSGMLATLDEGNAGFLVYPTQIANAIWPETSLHENKADLAEQQLRGEFIDPLSAAPYVNEVYYNFDDPPWKGPGFVQETVINWFEGGGTAPLLNFPNDDPIPDLPQFTGVVIEILTYLELTEGQHKLGLYTEGGHKVTSGLTGNGPLLSIVDNSGELERVPSYFARNEFFDVIAPQDGYYPIRVLWFQSDSREEAGLLLELFSVADKELHLVNDSSDPLSIKAYRAGILLDPGTVLPTVELSADGSGLTIQYTGTLEAAPTVKGPWDEIGNAGESPLTIQPDGEARFLRSKN